MQDIADKSSQNPTGQKKKSRPIVKIGLWIIKRIEGILIRYSQIPDTPFIDTNELAWINQLEDNWEAINKELTSVLTQPERLPNFQDISKDQSNISKDDKWKTFFLYGYGFKMPENCERCPETTRLVESIPNMMTAFFSILAPGKHIPPHRGPYKGLIRCHLALKVPEPKENCWIKVGDETSHWEEGKCIVFDDTYVHQVQNDTEGQRVVLFLDIVRPVRFPGSWLNRFIIQLIRWSPYIQDARRNQKAWEYRMGDM